MTITTRLLGTLALAAALLAGARPALADCPPAVEPPDAATVQRLQREAQDRGLLWQVSKGGQRGWLYGTVHVGRLAWLFPGPQLAQALREAELVALELDPLDPAVTQGMAHAQAELAQRHRPVPAALQARLKALVQAECLPGAGLDGLPAMLQAVTLSVLAGRRDGLDPGFAQEVLLSVQARQAGKPVRSLETAAGQLAVLMDGADSADGQALLAKMVSGLEDGSARRQLGQLAELWARGDLDTLANQDLWCQCADSPAEQALLKRLNDGRNPALADGIARALAAGQPVFAAVGALHMTGPQALPLLLQQRGYTVTRVPLGTP